MEIYRHNLGRKLKNRQTNGSIRKYLHKEKVKHKDKYSKRNGNIKKE